MLVIAEASASDLDAVLDLNASAVPNVNLVSRDTLRRLREQACYFKVAKSGGRVTSEGRVIAFLLALPEGAAYESMNYRWFSARYPKFVYIDRIVVGSGSRREGVGRRLYEDLAAMARERAPVLACEVNLRPPNPGSMTFHEAFGFEEVGQQDTEGGTKRVRMLVKRLEAEALEHH